MFKTLIAALLVVSTAFALTGAASAGPADKQAPTTEFYMERASQNQDNGGN